MSVKVNTDKVATKFKKSYRHNTKDYPILFRVSKEDRDIIFEISNKGHVSVSAFVREAVHHYIKTLGRTIRGGSSDEV